MGGLSTRGPTEARPKIRRGVEPMERQIVVAVNEPLQPRQVVKWISGRRLFVVRELTPEEYEVKRRENAADRAARGIRWEDAVSVVQGDDPMHCEPVPGAHPALPPPGCRYFYLMRDV